MHIDFFRLYTVRELPGSDLDLPWSSIILSATSCEPVITRAVAALGCMHRAHTDRTRAISSGPEPYTDSYELYQKAVVALRRYIDRAPELSYNTALETTLIAVLLLFCFEVLCGDDDSASKHLTAAYTVLSGHRSRSIEQGSLGRTTLVLDAGRSTSTDILTQVFLRLASDWLASGPLEYSILRAVCERPVPQCFPSNREAAMHLDALCSEIWLLEETLYDEAMHMLNMQHGVGSLQSHECARECLAMAKGKVLDLDKMPAFQKDVSNTVTALQRWRAAFASLMESHPRPRSVLLLEIQYLQAWLIIQTMNDFDQTVCDGLHEDLERTISAAEEYMAPQFTIDVDTEGADRSLRSLPNLGNNLATSICLVIEKCRDLNVRRRAIRLLEGVDLRGVFDTPYLLAYYQHLVDEEETRVRALHSMKMVDLKCQDIPSDARFVETLMCYCESGQSGDEFYRQRYGRMVYVVHVGNGSLELGESFFQVRRTTP